jgi:hypothetical protein
MASQRYTTHYNMNLGVVTLIVKTAFSDDKGNYKCILTNIVGSKHTSANLLVKPVPNVDETSYINPNALRHLENSKPIDENTDPDDKYQKPYFVKVPKDTQVRESTVVRFDCLAFGRPKPELTWYFNEKELKEDVTHKVTLQ